MNDVLRIARLKIALQRAFLGRAILIFTIWGTKGIRCALGAPVPGIYHLWMVNRQHQGTGPLLLLESTLKSREKIGLGGLGFDLLPNDHHSEIILRLLVFPHVHTKLYILIKFRAME